MANILTHGIATKNEVIATNNLLVATLDKLEDLNKKPKYSYANQDKSASIFTKLNDMPNDFMSDRATSPLTYKGFIYLMSGKKLYKYNHISDTYTFIYELNTDKIINNCMIHDNILYAYAQDITTTPRGEYMIEVNLDTYDTFTYKHPATINNLTNTTPTYIYNLKNIDNLWYFIGKHYNIYGLYVYNVISKETLKLSTDFEFNDYSQVESAVDHESGDLYIHIFKAPADCKMYKYNINSGLGVVDKYIDYMSLMSLYPIRAMSLTIYDRYIYIIGGVTNNSNYGSGVYIPFVFKMSIDDGTIVELEDYPLKYPHVLSVLLNDTIYCFGGYPNIISVYKYSPKILKNQLIKLYPVINEMDVLTNSISMCKIPANIKNHTATLVGTDIYVIGGYTGTAKVHTVYKYNILTDTWSTLLNIIPTEMAYHTSTLVGTDIYIIGGYNTVALDTVYKYNTLTDTWSLMTNKIPVSISWHTATLVGTDIYVIGGYNGTSTVDTVYKYNTLTDTWSLMTNRIPIALYAHAATLVGTDIYVIGGWVGGPALNTVYKYITLTDTWSLMPNLIPTVLRSLTSTLVGTDIYVIGGYDNGTGPMDTIYKYNTLTDTWSLMPNRIPTNIYYHTSTLIGTNIYVIGGANDISGTSDNIYRLNIFPKNILTIEEAMSAMILDDIYIFGGSNKIGQLSYAFKYNITSNKTTPLPNIPYIAAAITVVAYGNDIYLFAGVSNPRKSFKYNTITGIYVELVNLPVDNSHGKGLVYKNNIYIITSSSYIIRYNIIGNTYDILTNISEETLIHFTISLHNDNIYIFGGINLSNIRLSSSYVYNIPTNTVSPIANMPMALNSQQSITCRNLIYIIGGLTNSGAHKNIFVYNIDLNTYTTIFSNNVSITGTAHMYNNKILIVMGLMDNDKISNIRYLDILDQEKIYLSKGNIIDTDGEVYDTEGNCIASNKAPNDGVYSLYNSSYYNIL